MLSDRQIELLEYIIKEYMDTSEPVGSTYLVDKYNLRYSAATVRNEMSELLELGFLDMLHASSGRVPTAMAYKFFLDRMIEEEDLPVLHEVAMKQRLWSDRYNFYKLLRQAAMSLADVTKELAITTAKDGHVTYAGTVNVLNNKEFWDIDVAREALGILDSYELLEKIFNRVQRNDEKVYCVIGRDLGYPNLRQCSVVYAPYQTKENSGVVAVLGPSRMRYQSIIPAVKYVSDLIEELADF